MEECLELYTAFFETLTLNEAHLAARAGEGFTTATELADTLVREAGLPFRLAHKIVAGMVQEAVRSGVPSSQLTLAMLQRAAQQVLGSDVALSEAQFSQALDPAHFVQVRSGLGGVAPAATAALLDDEQAGIDQGFAWLAAAQARLIEAGERRAAATAQFVD